MAPKSKHSLEFYYDISCPFAYIASRRVEALASRTNADLIWRPVLLGAIYRATSAPQGAAGSASDVFNPTKKTVTSQTFQTTLQRFKIPYKEPPKHPIKTTAPLRLLYFVDDAQRPQLTHALFRAYWFEGKDVSDKNVLTEVVEKSGISNVDDVVKALEDGRSEGDTQREALETSTDLAVQRGSPGVPAFWIPDEKWIDRSGQAQTGRLYWGQDRMHFVEAVLESLNLGGSGHELSSSSRRLLEMIPRCARKSVASDEEVKLEFWYDFSSPWAFLGWTQLPRLQRQFGSKLKIELYPFLLGILFREIGAPNLPGSAVSKQRANYNKQDHRDWVRWWNVVNYQEGNSDKDIAFYWADKFPIRTPTVLRAVLAEPKLVDVLYRACWERNRDMSSDDVLQSVITEAGYDASAILARANEGDIKTDLRARTQRAKEIGLCGVPSYRVFRRKSGQGDEAWKMFGHIVWGQDDVSIVEDFIAGWDGEGVADVGTGRANKL